MLGVWGGKMRNALIWALALLVTSPIYFYGFSEKETASSGRAPASEVRPETKPKKIPVGAEFATYRFKRNVEATLAGQKWIEMGYEGRLSVEIESSPNRTTQLNLSFTLEGTHEPSSTLSAEISPEGQVNTISVPKFANEQQVAVLKDLLALYQFEGREDANGKYLATFTETDQNQLKIKTRYLDSKTEIVFSEHQRKLSIDSAFPEWIRGTEESRVGVDEASSLQTRSTYEFTLVPSEGKRLVKNVSKSESEKVSFSLQERPGDLRVQAKGLRGVAFQRALKSWAQISPTEQLQLFRKIHRSLAQSPEELIHLRNWMKAHPKNPEALAFGVGVLATVGSEAAQAELLRLYQTTENLRHLILTSLTTTEVQLDETTQQFLQQKASETETHPDIAMSAAFALGASLKKEPNPEFERTLSDLWRDAESPETRLGYLDAMGNSGSARFLPSIETALHSESVAMREKAVFALRWIDDPQARTLLDQAEKDPDSRIQVQATLARRFLAP